MAVSDATAQAQIQALTQRVNALASTVHTLTTALGPLLSAGNASFLAGLSKLPHQSGLGTDPNTGSTWATGERGYVNNAIGYINSIDANLQSHGYMA